MADDDARSPPVISPHLAQLQRWFQAVITHPGGVHEGAASAEGVAALVAEIGEVAEPSSRQSAEERMAVYAQAYWARLLECLREEFPIVRATAGEEAFDMLVVGYLATFPSRS
ncbi:MAG: putative DNA-binding domain-containing protein, partial [Planctomycetales bacterium]|nr:putative DNA-binding domain-containing protein [Planctomycetales bacterium]